MRIEDLVKYARQLPLVSYVGENLYTCSDEGLSSIAEKIKEQERRVNKLLASDQSNTELERKFFKRYRK